MNNQIKIIYDPYEKTIQYQYRNSSDRPWDALDPSASLTSEDFTKGTLQDLAEEITEELRGKYCTDGRGVDLFFSGTDPDWTDLRKAVEKYDPEGRITCRGRMEKLSAPDEVLPKIQDIFERLSAQLDSIQDSEIREPIDRYKDTVKPGINLVVTGTYSAGKSSFINALIGEELLPASSDPTTAKIFKIVSRPGSGWLNTVIRFRYKGTDVELRFNQDGYYVRTGELQRVLAGSPLKDRLDEVRQAAEPSPAYIYRIIDTLNNFQNISPAQERGGGVSEVIEIDTPFYESTLPLSKYGFVIYDTPGSDSANHKEHYEILKKALEGQTNGLPILVTDPDSKDSTGVDKLKKELSGIEALDLSNIMIIINKADEKGVSTLQDIGKKDFAAQEGAKKRIFVLSALVGLGAKKKDMEQCVSGDAFDIFEEKRPSFLNGKRQFFRYGAISRRLSESANAAGEAANFTGDDSQRLLHNSGLWTVEYGIRDFADRYAASNKCQQAKRYLSQAIGIAKEELERKKQLKEKHSEELLKSFDDKQQLLLSTLDKTADKELKKLNDSCVKKRKSVIEAHQLKKDSLASELDQKWNQYKKKDRDSAESRLKMYVDGFINEELDKTRSALSKAVSGVLKNGVQAYKDACIRVVTESKAIGEEERRFLSRYIMGCPVPDWRPPKFSSERLNLHTIQIFIWKLNIFNASTCAENVIECINDTVATGNQTYGGEIEAQLKKWKEAFIDGLKMKLADFNPELNDKRAELEKSRGEVERLSNTLRDMEQKQRDIEQLFQFSAERE